MGLTLCSPLPSTLIENAVASKEVHVKPLFQNLEAMLSMLREGASAILFDADGNLLLQLRDNLPNIRDPGKVSLFGGRREGDESFLDCIVREVHEEIGYYLAPTRFENIGRWSGPDYAFPGHTFCGEIFLARGIPVEQITITEGRLRILPVDEIDQIRSSLSLPTQFALGMLFWQPVTVSETKALESSRLSDHQS
jgi:8-oxo-dGTP diphosphatase